jgi:hypothetical protein
LIGTGTESAASDHAFLRVNEAPGDAHIERLAGGVRFRGVRWSLRKPGKELVPYGVLKRRGGQASDA